MTNKITDICCYVKGKPFIGSINGHILSGTYGIYNNNQKTAKFISIYEAFNFVLDNCDTSSKYVNRPFIKFQMVAPGWLILNDKPAKVLFGIYFIDKSRDFAIKFYSSKIALNKWIIVKEKIKTIEDVKKIMKDIIELNPLDYIDSKRLFK